MSRIARQLCDDIVAPLRGKDREPFTRKCENKYSRSRFIDSQRASRTEPKSRSISQIKFKPEEVALDKSFVDTGVNTIVRGTLIPIFGRNYTGDKCVCKSPHKCHSNRRTTKEAQTYNFQLRAFSDKASINCVKTFTCGTQTFTCAIPQHHYNADHYVSQTDSREMDKSQIEYQSQIDKPLTDYLRQIGIMQKDSVRQKNMKHGVLRQLELKKMAWEKTSDLRPRENKLYNQIRGPKNTFPCIKYMGARRWCISQNPSSGPDF